MIATSITLLVVPSYLDAAVLPIANGDLAAYADLIVEGRVARMHASWDESAGVIYTYVDIDVSRVLKGPPDLRRVVVKQLGGRVGGTGFFVPEQARFAPEEEVLLYLERRPRDGSLYTSGLNRGKVTLRASRFAAFTFLGPGRWHEADAALPVYVDVSFRGQPGLRAGGLSEIAIAAAMWNNVNSSLQLAPGVQRPPRCVGSLEQNGRITVTFMDPCGEMSNSGSIIAIGGGWYDDAQTVTISGQRFIKFTQGDVVVNDSPLALAILTQSRCFQDVLTHEIGHAVGLGHSTDSTAIMFPFLDNACASNGTNPPNGLRSGRLGADDIAGLRFVYPLPAQTNAGPHDLIARVDGSTVQLSWRSPRIAVPMTAYVIEVGSTPRRANLGYIVVPPTNTTILVTAPADVYYVRVRAWTGTGFTEPSNELTVLIAPP